METITRRALARMGKAVSMLDTMKNSAGSNRLSMRLSWQNGALSRRTPEPLTSEFLDQARGDRDRNDWRLGELRHQLAGTARVQPRE